MLRIAQPLTAVRDAVEASLSDVPVAVLAVSGGVDSMVLLDAAVARLPRARLIVATFDHGSGAPATQAAAFVSRGAIARGVQVVLARDGVSLQRQTEETWRNARWRFLRDVADRVGGTVVTAHTRDDQLETVLMRAMRGAGARGLAGLYANAPVRRPLLGFTRAELWAYARAASVEWVDDPTNADRRYFRNRVRLDLLPAIRRVQPRFEAELLDLSNRAAAWRAEVEAIVETTIIYSAADGVLDVALDGLAGYSRESLGVLWPVLASRAGIALDRRGTARLVEFTISSQVGRRIQLAGSWEVVRSRNSLELCRLREHDDVLAPAVLHGTTDWGAWRFRPSREAGRLDVWSARLPEGAPLVVRRWAPGDSIAIRPGEPARKVKRFLTEAGVSGRRRANWPVVVAGDQIVWIPGVCRGSAATARSGRPARGRPYRCDYHDQ